ncbi:MAG TPA: PfkB family carbohydrate kinase [Acetobacteraceae bacterium]|nr:PfkB family carbohydrate kinase [Acetobacteraceae bacterium]
MRTPLRQAIVIGNATLDETFALDALPRPGESVLSGPPTRDPGGKGANQALLLARAGLAVRLVARIGRDPEGAFLRARLAAEGLAAGLIEGAEPTDRSVILIDGTGENCIVTTAAAANAVTPVDAERALAEASADTLLLLQGNLSFETTRTSLAAARARGLVTVFNPAPVKDEFASLWPLASLVVLNEQEAKRLAGREGEEGLKRILAAGADSAVVTLGARGALLLHAGGLERSPAAPAVPVDTTGAGDTFTAVLATARFARQLGWKQALTAAAAAASITVSARGAFASFPTRAGLAEILDAAALMAQ